MSKATVVASYRHDGTSRGTFGRASAVSVMVEVEFKYGDHIEALAALTEALESVRAQIAEVSHAG